MTKYSSLRATPVLAPRFTPLETDLLKLVYAAIQRSATSCVSDADADDELDNLAAAVRAQQSAEGYLLETILARLLSADKRLRVLTGVRLPMSTAAIEAARANNAQALAGVSLDSHVYSGRGFAVDLVVVDQECDKGFLVELKRSTASYVGTRLGDICTTMRTAALSLQDALWRDHQRLVAKAVELVLVDCSDRDERPNVTRLADLDRVFGVDGVGDAMAWARLEFKQAAQTALIERFAHMVDSGGHTTRRRKTPFDAPQISRDDADVIANVEIDRPPPIHLADISFAGARRGGWRKLAFLPPRAPAPTGPFWIGRWMHSRKTTFCSFRPSFSLFANS